MTIGHIEMFVTDDDELMIRVHGGEAQTLEEYLAPPPLTTERIEEFQKQCQSIIDAVLSPLTKC